jgi:hypothetical protein
MCGQRPLAIWGSMKTKPLLDRRVQIAFGVALLALFAAGTICYRGFVVSGESDKWVRHIGKW